MLDQKNQVEPSPSPLNPGLAHMDSTLPESILTDTKIQTPTKESKKSDQAPVMIKNELGHPQSLSYEDCLQMVAQFCVDLDHVDPQMLASHVFGGLYSGVPIEEIKDLIIRTAAMVTSKQPEYSKVAARALIQKIDLELAELGIKQFSSSIDYGYKVGLIGDTTHDFIQQHHQVLNQAIKPHRNHLFEYFGLKTVYDRYLQKDPVSRRSVESPQFFMMRVACGLSKTAEEAIEFYNLISSFEYMPATPTLFNSGTRRPQMSSCYLLDSPEDSLDSIYDRYKEIAKLSKFAGGIGMSYSRVRSRGSLIEGTNGHSNGIVPFLKTLDSSVHAVNQGGKRKGACCVYLENWHADVLDFLELRENTGDESMRAHNLNLANWVSDLFMKRVEQDGEWSLFDPSQVPHFVDLFGEKFETAYVAAEKQGLATRTLKARDMYARMMKTLAETGNGWMTFKDHSNNKGNQTLRPGNVIHLSNLCTEILEVTSDKEIAVCNLGSINLSKYVKTGEFDFEQLSKNVQTAMKYLDRVIDINFYPVNKAEDSNNRWRPVGLGVMGLQDVFFKLGLSFDDPKALELSTRIQEEIYFHALTTSNKLAEELGPHDSFEDTRAAQGDLQFDLWGVEPSQPKRWQELKEKIKQYGLRNSLMIAIAPTATIASIVGSFECIEPQVSNLFKKETLSGEFLLINPYLVRTLRKLDLWNDSIRDKITLSEGSIQGISEIPEETRNLFRTSWELPMKSLINLAAARGAYIDQGQSLNLFMESPTIGKLSSMYMYAWKKGVKTTYYLRSRPATKIRKTLANPKEEEQLALACSLENPESCESCS